MEQTLLIESGGTKADWVFLEETVVSKGQVAGIHPNFLNFQEIVTLSKKIDLPTNPSQIIFYGAGCANPDNKEKLKKAFQEVFKTQNIEINTDLLAAARAGLGSNEGLAFILGTGSVGAYYDGHLIKDYEGGLGYLFGDEGSGAYLGKLLIKKWLKNQLNTDLSELLRAYLELSKDQMITKVYTNSRPNKILAQLTYFISDYKNHPQIDQLIRQSFEDFEQTTLQPLIDKYPNKPIIFVGSVAFYFKSYIDEILVHHSNNYKVVANPLENLISYHTQKG